MIFIRKFILQFFLPLHGIVDSFNTTRNCSHCFFVTQRLSRKRSISEYRDIVMNDRMKLKKKIVNKLELPTFQRSESKFLKCDVMSTNSFLTESTCEPIKSSSLTVTNYAANAYVEAPDVKESVPDKLGETSNFPEACSTETCRTDTFDIKMGKKDKHIGTLKIGKRLFSWNKVVKRNRKLGRSFTCSFDVR